MDSCLFCKIVRKEIPAKLIFDDEHVVAFHDIHPVAPTHVLVIPKKHVVDIANATPEDGAMISALVLAAQRIARDLGVDTNGYRLVINNGVDAGQSVFHLHVHLLGGRSMAWPPG